MALRVIDGLEALGIPYHLGGSLASSFHGVLRHTQDIDVVVELSIDAVDLLVSRLGVDFYVDAGAARRAVLSSDSFNLIHRETAIKLDLFVRGNSAFDREEFARAQLVALPGFEDRLVRVKSAEDTLLRKLRWYQDGGRVSERQWNDVLGVARVQRERLDRGYLERWARELEVADLLDRVLQAE